MLWYWMKKQCAAQNVCASDQAMANFAREKRKLNSKNNQRENEKRNLK